MSMIKKTLNFMKKAEKKAETIVFKKRSKPTLVFKKKTK